MNAKQAQFLKTRFASEITGIEIKIKALKAYAASIYGDCDKEFPESTDLYFRSLNMTRDRIRQAEKERNALAALQDMMKYLSKVL